MQEVIKKEIVKLLDTSIIYPIADSPWVSPIHCVPKKGGITVVTNENDELVPTRTVTEATTKDHFPLPFMDQMLERLAGNKYFCFLDDFSGYFQIPIDPNDQEKITFTCPFGTYAYRRMPFGLCNAPATFQRCMLAIFHDMIEESVEHCKYAHLVLNWENFMVKERIVLGHKVSRAGLEVDKAKINLLEKDTLFEFNDECQKAFELLKEKLTCTPVIISLNWNLSFELVYDASDFAVRAVLGQKDEIKDRKGTENIAADYLSPIENDESSDDSDVDDNSPGATLITTSGKNPTYSKYVLTNAQSSNQQPSGQVKNTNKALKRILEKTVKDIPAIWSRKLDDALWAFRTAYKTPTGTTPYKLLYVKNFHLPFEIEHRAYWALKNCNPDLIVAVKHQYPSGYVEIYGKDGKIFIVNGHRLKLYHEEEDYNDPREADTPFFPKE
ncbi:reverse transcriptase domain-containing protein [Tanacetum coccineum]